MFCSINLFVPHRSPGSPFPWFRLHFFPPSAPPHYTLPALCLRPAPLLVCFVNLLISFHTPSMISPITERGCARSRFNCPSFSGDSPLALRWFYVFCFWPEHPPPPIWFPPATYLLRAFPPLPCSLLLLWIHFCLVLLYFFHYLSLIGEDCCPVYQAPGFSMVSACFSPDLFHSTESNEGFLCLIQPRKG